MPKTDEAVDLTDKFLDEVFLNGLSEVRIIHGHGTGALRLAIRNHLSSHKAIQTFRPGEQSEGGDGVTVAFLKG